MIESNVFKKRMPIPEKLLQYGFIKKDKTYIYKTKIMDGQFNAEITISHDSVNGKLFDAETGEEYALVHAENQFGTFIGEVRDAYKRLLENIATKCFRQVPFASSQANQLAELINEKYHEQPDFPFKKFPDYGVFRNHENNKWYGLIMNITKDKLTKNKADANQKIEILDLKIAEEKHDKFLGKKGFYPSYHMHKTSWITIVLNNSVDDNIIFSLLEKSRASTLENKAKSSWLIPANPKYYDIETHFKIGQRTIWKQSTKISVGDTVYMYVTSPVKAVRYKCRVIKNNIPYQYDDKNVKMQKIMELEVEKEYEPDFCTFAKLKQFNIKAVRGPRRISKELVSYLNN